MIRYLRVTRTTQALAGGQLRSSQRRTFQQCNFKGCLCPAAAARVQCSRCRPPTRSALQLHTSVFPFIRTRKLIPLLANDHNIIYQSEVEKQIRGPGSACGGSRPPTALGLFLLHCLGRKGIQQHLNCAYRVAGWAEANLVQDGGKDAAAHRTNLKKNAKPCCTALD